jgi:regulatory protein
MSEKTGSFGRPSRRQPASPLPHSKGEPRGGVLGGLRLTNSGGGNDGTITAIEPQRRRGRYNLFVDGEFALALDAETLAASGLKTGSAVAGNDLIKLAAEALRKRALDAALRLLAYRPRSEQEIRTRLLRHGLPPDVIGATIDRLRGYGYVDDAAFARAWVDSRSAGSPRGQRLLRRELRGKGVDVEVATEAATATDEQDAARRAAEKKARSLRGLEYPDFRNRLAGYLQRRGFGYDVIKPVISELWREQRSKPPEDDGWDVDA